ncbi:MAG: pseudaminic acid synthase [Candidatus Lernaella stagnicola]|nr:pseudaminic acid synthase [Candidatus Lernaella stagnicola]
MNTTVRVSDREIGPGLPTFIIAEMSANHGHDYERAVQVIRAAKQAGADAIKLQTYTPDTMTLDCRGEHFTVQGTAWHGRNLYELYGEAYTPWEWQPKLQEVAREEGLIFFSTPFDATAVDFLEELQVPVFKVASFEIVDIPLLLKIAATGKPVIMSTGMATLAEITEAVTALADGGCRDLVLLKCTSAYPASPEEMHLRTITDLRERFGVPIGLSDHTLEVTMPAAAVALGACVVEKHFTLDRGSGGPDSHFSLQPDEFAAMVKAVRTVEKALGEVRYGVKGEEDKQVMFRRSVFVAQDIRAGETLTPENVRVVRPGVGLHPRDYAAVLGKRAAVDIKRGTPLSWEMVERES